MSSNDAIDTSRPVNVCINTIVSKYIPDFTTIKICVVLDNIPLFIYLAI